MAAPKEAYAEVSLYVGDCEHGIAKLDPDYSTFKARFYLDDVIGLKEGVVGCVTSGSINAQYHNLVTRSGKGRLGNLILLNDGGINTKGKSTINNNSLLWANNIRNNYTFLSAYHVDSTFTGVRYRTGGGSWTEVSFFSTPVQKISETVTKDFDSGLTKGTLIEMQGLIKNAEGDNYSTSLSLVLLSNIYEYDTFKRTSACSDTGQTTVSLWITQDTLDLLDTIPEDTGASTGVYFYTDIEQTTKVSTGWYYGLEDTKSFYADSNGQITHYSTCIESKGDIYLSLEDNGDGTYNPVYASVDPIYTLSDVTITGRVDTDPSLGTPNGKDFTVTILQGEVSGYYDIDMPTGETYYWQNVLVSPSGFVLNKQEPI